ncbi:polysaccharide lyase family 8 super-sandwich domain-containing protein [Paenibacillus sp. G2S3]|uniref:polysaccharide lyase family 8 super-sandwich domain-containing protein n=1 Tax=Paenibacillus sp. G2S3 TaxID=3047872 RepID=UPI0024C15D92|nr:polysaccharide lyase family 8 super-sandwich domain-containing protein [Paenibacillus sp. G2S3]WHY20831.1 polysaccharide lyase family 8 super-sandwich domain-containing protein [Paenibacillus sp. G2S3]
MRKSSLVLVLVLIVDLFSSCVGIHYNADGKASAAASNLILNGSFENTTSALNATWTGVTDSAPVGWSLWVPTGSGKGTNKTANIKIDAGTAHDGTRSMLFDAFSTSRISINQGVTSVIPGKSYRLKVWLKTDNVTGQGAYFRTQYYNTAKVGDGPSSPKITGTHDWTLQQVLLTMPANATKLVIEPFLETGKGKLWIDDVVLEEYAGLTGIALDRTAFSMVKGDTVALLPTLSPLTAADKTVVWTSSNPEAATVDAFGNVTGTGVGSSTIKIATPDGILAAECLVNVESSDTMQAYHKLRLKWYDRLSGGQYDAEDPDIAASISAQAASAATLWESMDKSSGRTFLWSETASTTDSQFITSAYNRLKTMALAYSVEGSELYGNSSLANDIVSAINWMYTNRYNPGKSAYGNWWDWEIGTPQIVNDLMVLMYDHLTPQQINQYLAAIDAFCPDPKTGAVLGVKGTKMTGANLLDKALVVTVRGVIGNNSAKIIQGRDSIGSEYVYTTHGDGVYKDGSLVQHNNIAYTGGYGSVWLKGTADMSFLLTDSPWPITDPNVLNIYEWVAQTYEPVIYNGQFMDSVNGRGISRKGSGSARGLIVTLLRMAETAPENVALSIKQAAKEWISANMAAGNYYDGLSLSDITIVKKLMNDGKIHPRGALIKNQVFAGMDRVVHLREGYGFGLSLFSNRISAFEKGNNENLKGWYTGIGMTYLYDQDLYQYRNDFWPTVNAYRLSGTTTDGSGQGMVPVEWKSYMNPKTWVGGSSLEGLYGAAGMDFSLSQVTGSDLQGKKSWFMFDDEIVALGSGISKTTAGPQSVETIIDNRMLNEAGNNELLINGAAEPSQPGWAETVKNVQWAHLEGNVPGSDVGYYFPDAPSLLAQREARTGSWKEINTTQSDVPVTRNYLSLAFEHGDTPSNGSYSYVLLPNRDIAGTEDYSGNPDIEVLSNTKDVHAVREKKLGITAANFWNAGTVDFIKARNPASVMIQQTDQELIVSVSDPTQSQNLLSLELDVPGLTLLSKDSETEVLQASGNVVITVDVTNSIGATHVIKFNINEGEAPKDEYDELRGRWVDYLTGGSSFDPHNPDIAKSITALSDKISNQVQTGYWDTMNKQMSRTYLWSDKPGSTADAFDTAASYNRLKDMAIAFSTTGSPLYQNMQLKTDILSGLDFLYANWYNETKQEKGNWFEWEIGIPLALGDTMALMFEYLSVDQIASYTKAIDKFCPDPTKRTNQPSLMETGANRLDKALAVVLRGIHNRDSGKIKQGRDAVSQVLPYVTRGDGFYEDGSFIQHNNIAYTGSYGAVLLGDMMKMMTLLTGSSWPLTDVNLKNVYNWVTDSYEPLVYRKQMMDMVFGRSIARGNRQLVPWAHILRLASSAPPEQAARFKSMVKYWFEADTAIESYYEGLRVADIVLLQTLMNDPEVQPSGDLTVHKQFAAMDRIVHHRPGYAFGLSMSSARIANYEAGTENLKGWYTGEGMTYLYNQDLDQYADAFWPTVNAYRLPGVTSDGATRGAAKTTSKTWVGGSSIDGLYGAAGMDLDPDNSTLSGKKSWFMFDDEIVALGAGITSTDNRKVETIVDNRKLKESGDNVLTINGEVKPSALGWSESMNQVHWAHLEGNIPGSGIGYYFPDAPTIDGLQEARTGAWKDINQGGSTEPITRNYASLSIAQGTKPVDQSYSYVLLPNQDQAATARYSSNPDIEIIANTDSVQAVKEQKLELTAMNFWVPGMIESVRAKNPASIIIKESGDELTIAISDPTQSQSVVKVDVGKAALEELMKDPTVTVMQLSPRIELAIDTSGSKGKSHVIKFRIDPNAEPYEPSDSEPDEAAKTKLYVSEDAYVNGGSKAAINYSSVNYLQIRNGSGDTDRRTYLKFDLRPFVGEVGSVKLNVYGKTNDGAGTLSDIGVFGVSDDSWTEATLNYNNAPKIGNQAVLQTFSGPEQWRQFDITSWVGSEFPSDPVISLALRQVGYNLATDIRSRKNENGKYAAYLEILPKDTTPPVTKATVLGESIEGGVYKGKVNIIFDATDLSNGGAVGWGVKRTEYRLNGGAWNTVTESVYIENPGTYGIDYRSVDKAGNVETFRQLQVTIMEPTERASMVISVPEILTVGETGTAVTSVVYSDGSHYIVTEGIIYESSDPNVASIGEDGHIEAKGPGISVISSVYDNMTASYPLKVYDSLPELVSISLSGPASLKIGQSDKVVTTAVYSDNSRHTVTEGVIYESSNRKVVTVTAAGQLQALVPGMVVITAKYGGQQSSLELQILQAEHGTSTAPNPQPQAPSVLDEMPGQLQLNAASLNDLSAAIVYEGKLSVLVLPGMAADILKQKPLRVEASNFNVTLPAAVLQQLQALIPVEQLAGSQIILEASEVEGEVAQRMLASAERQSGAELHQAGEFLDFKLYIVTGDGKKSVIQQFVERVILELNTHPEANRTLLGGYYLPDSGLMEYMGGSWLQGKVALHTEHSGAYAVLEYNKSYDDVPTGHWVYKPVQELSAKHLIQGTGLRKFDPNRLVTRAEFTVMLARLLDLEGESSTVFADVSADQWYAEEVAQAVEAGIVYGVSETYFAPESHISRQEMAVMVMRAYAYVSGKKADLMPVIQFDDLSAAATWARESIIAAQVLGFVQGRSDRQFDPGGSATRAESAMILHNLLTIKIEN